MNASGIANLSTKSIAILSGTAILISGIGVTGVVLVAKQPDGAKKLIAIAAVFGLLLDLPETPDNGPALPSAE